MLRELSLENGFFLLLLLAGSIAFVWMVQEFLQPVFWAVLLASLFNAVQARLSRRLGNRPSLSAVLVLLLILLIVILPLFFVGIAVTREAVALYQRITSGEVNLRAPLQWLGNLLPIVSGWLDQVGFDADKVGEWLSSAAVTVSQFVAARALSIGQNTLSFAIQFLVMMYLVFFFLRDGTVLIERLVRALPLGDRRERRLFARFADVSRATLKGTVVVGVVQGALGGVSLALVGIDGAVLWGVVMTILSVLPAVGASIIWIPAAIWLFASGAIVKGIALVVMGVAIGFVDNVLRPILVGRETQMPDYVILLSTLGGITAFGLSGFIVGPILAALCVAGWEMFAEDFGENAGAS
jgi:predicted PurR-regulated permease PerM